MRLTEAEAAARRGVREVLADVATDAPVIVALSGGADSLALAAATAFVAAKDGLTAEALVVDHGLQDASAEVAEQAVRQARTLGLAARSVRVEVGTAGGPEAAARSARRAALLDAAGPGGVVLLGHTRDDQAESVLLGLGRGSGARSLAGMRAVDGPWRRPLLVLTREDTETVCRAHATTWWDDPHNADVRFRRSRLRTEVLPLLEDVLGGGVADALARTADLLRDDADLLDHLAAQVDRPSDVGVLAALPEALRSRVLRRSALEAGASPAETGAVHVAALDQLITRWSGQERVELPGGVSCRREGSSLIFGPTPVAG
ncbi:tRNA lysidine(34) synthetase TilS [Aeromicrobium halocynthiae]|uniref:tRNA(Ile)-lysidine synthase n=1 Tax=Aeromicrobium halocynthiae TaxID=560557 RepID=A0ABN2VXA5_9ACTN